MGQSVHLLHKAVDGRPLHWIGLNDLPSGELLFDDAIGLSEHIPDLTGCGKQDARNHATPPFMVAFHDNFATWATPQ